MKKMNPNNEEKRGDELLAELLKVSLTEVPTEAFSEKALAKFLMTKSAKIRVQRPLRFPIAIMALMAAFLLISMPWPWTESSEMMPSTVPSVFSEYLLSVFMGIDLWYVISPLLLALAVILLFQLAGRQFSRLTY